MRFLRLTILILLVVALAATSALAGTLTALATFGGGDGWLAPLDRAYLTIDNTQRGMSFNPTTGHVLIANRAGGNSINLVDGATGADAGALSLGGGIISGGTFAINAIDVAADGAIYVGNLSTTAAANFKIYRWGTEADAAPTVAFDAVSGVDRTGDSFAATGSGAGTVLAAAGSATTNRSNFVTFSTANGLTYSATAYTNVPGTLTTSNDYRLGLTFVDSDTLIGNQGTNARVTDFGAMATVTDSIPLGVAQRALDYAVIGNRPFIAVIDTGSSLVQVFDITDPTMPFLVASGNNTSGMLTANVNATGAVAFANVTGSGATIYAMSTNQGLQAFELSGVPEPGSALLLAVGAAVLGLARRRARR